MNIIIATLISFFIVLLLAILAAWLEGKQKKEFFEKAIDKLTSFFNSKMTIVMDLYKAGPWYLVVYTEESSYPVWISHNNVIKSI